MTERSLQVTCRKGDAFAAYLHLSHQTGERTARTVATADGLLVVDYSTTGRAVGIEITAPRAVPLERLISSLPILESRPWPNWNTPLFARLSDSFSERSIRNG
jgi:uncharacterized protein YuzE